jgi:hypothetical protein
MNWFTRIRHAWTAFLYVAVAMDLFALVRHVPDIPGNPGGMPLVLATANWISACIATWALWVQLDFNRRHARPIMWAETHDTRRPLRFRQLGYDPDGFWAYGTLGVVTTSEQLVIHRMAPRTAVYVHSDLGMIARLTPRSA